jgi:hypothetical protein
MASLTDRLKSAQPNHANRKICRTCAWLETVTPQVRTLINDWLEADHSASQLHEILKTPSDDVTPLEISMTGFRFHLKHHFERWPRGA